MLRCGSKWCINRRKILEPDSGLIYALVYAAATAVFGAVAYHVAPHVPLWHRRFRIRALQKKIEAVTVEHQNVCPHYELSGNTFRNDSVEYKVEDGWCCGYCGTKFTGELDLVESSDGTVQHRVPKKPETYRPLSADPNDAVHEVRAWADAWEEATELKARRSTLEKSLVKLLRKHPGRQH